MSEGFPGDAYRPQHMSGEQTQPPQQQLDPFGTLPPPPSQHQQHSYPIAQSRHSSGIPMSPQQGPVYSHNPTASPMSHANSSYTGQNGQSQQEAAPDPTQNGHFFVGTYENAPPVQMQRRSSARSLGGSSVGSSRSIGQSVLSDPSFAPAPKHPGVGSNFEVMKAQYFGEGKEVASTPPDFSQITHSGTILARISTRSILTKKWKHSFWITYGGKLLYFNYNWYLHPSLTCVLVLVLFPYYVSFSPPSSFLPLKE